MAFKNWTIRLYPLLIVLAFLSCQSGENRINVDISDVEMEPVKIKRYEQKLFEMNPADLKTGLKKIQPEFEVFLNGDLDDSLSLLPLINYIGDSMLQNVNKDCQNTFADLSALENQLDAALRHYKYYYPESETPEVFTYISGFDYEHPVQLMDNNVLIAIDMYLGRDYFRYKKLGLPAYMLHRFDRHYIVRDCMSELAKEEINYRQIGSALLDMMINEGKIIYFIKAMIPTIRDSVLINYSEPQMEWAINSEGAVWAFLLENEMLYASENQPIQKFIYESPFTSYFGAESPPRLGWFIGWKIVDSFMQNNPDIALSQLMKNYDAQKILQESGYKPGI